GGSAAARARKEAAAAGPPRACARPAERSSSPATSSSGPSAAWARCQARRSGSDSGSVASASARCALRRSCGEAARYTAERTSGWRKVTRSPILSSPSASPPPAPPPPPPRPPPHQHGRASGPRRRDQHRPVGGCRESPEPPPEAVFDPPRQPRHVHPEAEPGGQLGDRQPPRQLQQRQRVTPRLGHNPVSYSLIQRPPDHRAEQFPCVTITKTLDQQLRQPGELLDRPARRDHQRDRLCQ